MPMFTLYKEFPVPLQCIISCSNSLSDIELSHIDTVRELSSVTDYIGINLSNIANGRCNIIDDIYIS